MHELTHNLSQYNTEAFNELVGTFSEMWKERNPEAYKKWTDVVRDRYSQFGTELTEDQVMEEILCDQMGEILHDEDFMNDLVDEHRSVAELFLDIIKQAIRKLREMFGLGDVFDSRFEEATLSEYNLLKDAEKFLTDALREKKMLDALEGKRVTKDYSVGDNEYRLSKVAYARWAEKARSNDSFPTSYDGYRIIETGESDYVNNVLVYTNDSTSNPKIAKILVIETNGDSRKHNETYLSKVRSALYEYEQMGYEQSGRSAIENVAIAFREVVFSDISGYRNGAFRKIRRFNKQQVSGRHDGQGVLGDGNGIREGSGEDYSISGDTTGGRSSAESRGNGDKINRDYSLDLSTDTENTENESEYREWDLPEAVENQLIADLESSYVEESEGDVYVDGEAKSYINVSLESRKGVKAKSILDLKGKDLRDAIQDWFRKYEDGFERTAYLDPKSVSEEDFGDGTVAGRVTFTGNWDKAKNWFGNATVYLRDKNTGVNIALPVAVVEMNYGGYTLFARAMGDVDVGYHKGDHSLDVLGYPKIVHADEEYRLYNDNYLSSGLQGELIAEGDIARGTSRPEGMEEYYPRISPWVEQQGLDIKNEQEILV